MHLASLDGYQEDEPREKELMEWLEDNLIKHIEKWTLENNTV